MSWTRLDDNFPANPKIAALSDAEFRVWVRVLCHCGRVHSPRIDDRNRGEIVGLTPTRIKKFVAYGLLDPVKNEENFEEISRKNGAIFEVHDWRNYQPKDATSAERQARLRAKRVVTNTVKETVTPTVTSALPRVRAFPSRPDPTQPGEPEGSYVDETIPLPVPEVRTLAREASDEPEASGMGMGSGSGDEQVVEGPGTGTGEVAVDDELSEDDREFEEQRNRDGSRARNRNGHSDLLPLAGPELQAVMERARAEAEKAAT
jgi:hypothetical protein